MFRPLRLLLPLFCLCAVLRADNRLDTILGIFPSQPLATWLGSESISPSAQGRFEYATSFTLKRTFRKINFTCLPCSDSGHSRRLQDAFDATRGGRYDQDFRAKDMLVLSFRKATAADLEQYRVDLRKTGEKLSDVYAITATRRHEYYGDDTLLYACDASINGLLIYTPATKSFREADGKTFPLTVDFENAALHYRNR